MAGLVIFTNGAEMKRRDFVSVEEAKQAMYHDYSLKVRELPEVKLSESFCNSTEATITTKTQKLMWMIISIPESNSLQVKLSRGTLRADVYQDPDYPGIDIEYIPDSYCSTNISNPRVLVEEAYGDVRALVWNDTTSEDYTDEFEFERLVDQMFFSGNGQKLFPGSEISEEDFKNKSFMNDLIHTIKINEENIHNCIDIYDKVDNLCGGGQISDELFEYITDSQTILDSIENEVVHLYPTYLEKYEELKYDVPLYNCDAIYMEAILNALKDTVIYNKDECCIEIKE